MVVNYLACLAVLLTVNSISKVYKLLKKTSKLTTLVILFLSCILNLTIFTFCILLKLRFNCNGPIFISLVFPQFTSFHSMFHSYHGLMNSINWPASCVWVFIAQLVEHCSANAEATGLNPVGAQKNFFRATPQLLKLQFNCNGHIFISFVFLQFTSFHSVFHSFHGLMNSINWPASSVWVFVPQLVEHCSMNAEATGSNPVEARKKYFFRATSRFVKLRFNCDGHISISISFMVCL